jgi:asparagine synthase (glutamine-hydrolysing)
LRRRDLAFRLPELLLMRVDKITMASSIETRVPFLDHRLVEYVLRLPESVVLDEPPTTRFGGAGDKPLLRAAASNVLPPAVIARRKIGLGAPMARWLRGSLGEQLEALVLADAESAASPFSFAAVQRLFRRHRSGERDYASYIWSIANVVLWRRQWLRP